MRIRNHLLVLYTVNCAKHVAVEATKALQAQGVSAHTIGNGTCFDSQVIIDKMLALIAHDNVGAVLLVGHGCEFIQADKLHDYAIKIGKPAKVIMDQKMGTKAAIAAATNDGLQLWAEIQGNECNLAASLNGLIIGVDMMTNAAKDSTVFSAVKESMDYFIKGGAAVLLSDNCPNPSALDGIIRPGRRPAAAGYYRLDTTQKDCADRGVSSASVTDRALDLITAGADLVLSAISRGCVAGSVVAPLLTMTAESDIAAVFGNEIDICLPEDNAVDVLLNTISGAPSASEALGIFEGQLNAL